MRKRVDWKGNEKKLREQAAVLSVKQIAHRYRTTIEATQRAMQRLHIHTRRFNEWTEQEDRVIRDLASENVASEIAKALPSRKEKAIRERANDLGIQMRQDYMGLAQASRWLDLHEETVRRIAKNAGIPLKAQGKGILARYLIDEVTLLDLGQAAYGETWVARNEKRVLTWFAKLPSARHKV